MDNRLGIDTSYLTSYEWQSPIKWVKARDPSLPLLELCYTMEVDGKGLCRPQKQRESVTPNVVMGADIFEVWAIWASW